MSFRALIIDDEPLARKLIANLLQSIDEVEVLGLYGTGREAIAAINSLEPDLIFLDIELKDMNGFDILNKIQVQMPLVIFVTAYDSYAIEAFDVFAFDYLLKPLTENRFYKSINRALETLNAGNRENLNEKISNFLTQLNQNEPKAQSKTKTRIPIPSGNKTIFIDKDEIRYILASNYHIELYTQDAKYVLRNSMYHILRELDAELFIRIHRSSIVNLNFVKELINSAYGEIDVKMEDGKKLRVSKGYRKQFLVKAGLRK